LFTSIRLPGPFQRLEGGLVVFHQRARSFAVAAAEFRVQQKIIIGFWHECIPITSGSLQNEVLVMRIDI
jgi:hypothetical protein